MRPLLAIIFLLLFLPVCVFAQESETTPSEQYLRLRRQYPPSPGLTPETVGNDPNAYRGYTLELSGSLSGIVETTDGGALLMLSTASNGHLNLTTSILPRWLQAGMRVRALVVVMGAEEGAVIAGIPDLQVVAVASAADIEDAEQRGREQATARAAREKRREAGIKAATARFIRPGRGSLASRGAVSPVGRAGSRFSAYLSEQGKAIFPYYKDFVAGWNRKLSDEQADSIAAAVLLYAEKYDIDPRLMMALLIAESDFRPQITSHKGAMGLGQLMPDEARRLNLSNPYDPVQNIAGMSFLLKERLNKYSGSEDFKDASMRHIILALASYNAGMGAVKKYRGVPPYKETQNYVKKIERIYRQLCQGE